MQKSVKFNFLDSVKKISKNLSDCHLQSNIDTDSKMSFRIAVTESNKHNSKTGNEYTDKNFKNGGFTKLEFKKLKSRKNISIKTL